MKVAIVYDRVNKFGGAERFLKTILEIFPEAPLFTLVYEPGRSDWVGDHQVIPTFFNKIKFLRSNHELLAPFAAMAFETHDFKKYDLIISVTSADAKSIITLPHQTHICICLTPTRYLWSGKKNYERDIKLKVLPRPLITYFCFADKLLSQRPDFFLAISEEVKKRIAKYYNRKSSVIYPPVDPHFFTSKPVPKNKRKYYLVVSRLVPYKRVDLVIKAFNKLKRKLIIVGEGSELGHLQKIANLNITFTGPVSDKRLREYYTGAKAVIFPQEEDFGLVPLEAQASGTPVIAYKKGGALETVVEGKTGLFFSKQTTDSLELAVKHFDKINFNYSDCINNAKRFTKKEFKQNLISFINEVV